MIKSKINKQNFPCGFSTEIDLCLTILILIEITARRKAKKR
jgi:hypothetical protein